MEGTATKYKPEQLVLMSEHDILSTDNIFIDEVLKMKENAAHILLPKGFITAREVQEAELVQDKITTGCVELDDVLGGGLDRKCITEFYGEAGCGKTQFALQVAANAWKKGAVYINTEDTFPSKRLQQLFQHLEQTCETNDLNKCGEKIFILQIKEVEELLTCVNVQLPRLLQANPLIEVVILDSIAAPFRGNYENCGVNRAQHIKEIGIGLLKCSKLHNLAILCINQVSASLETNDMVPCLGLVWSNIVTTRINIQKTEKLYKIMDNHEEHVKKMNNSDEQSDDNKHILNIRSLQVVFSPCIPKNLFLEYVILEQGIKVVKS